VNLIQYAATIIRETITKKKLNFKYLLAGIQRMWNVKYFFIPVITGTTVIVTRGLKGFWQRHQKALNRLSTKTVVLGDIACNKESATI
jgi:hypothetical protein